MIRLSYPFFFRVAILFGLVFLSACEITTSISNVTQAPQVVESIIPSITSTIIPTSTQTLTPTPIFTATITPTPLGGGTGKILFLSKRDDEGRSEAYTMNSDGSDQSRLTHNGYVFEIQWSPDGSKIAFTSSLDFQIYVINVDGSNETRLTNLGYNTYPRWSPDGKKIVFVSSRNTDSDADYFRKYSFDTALLLGHEIYVMNSDGSNQTRLTNNQQNDEYPEWSPDGEKIVFWSSSPNTGSNIYIMNSDGSKQIQLINNHRYNLGHQWSPDGKKIAFMSVGYNSANYEIHIINVDGSDEMRLTHNKGSDWEPRWSPNGKMLTFINNSDGLTQICTIIVDGSERRCLTETAYNYEPLWSPDGRKILFVSRPNVISDDYAHLDEICTMNIDGSEQKCLTNNQSADTNPQWSP